MKKCIACKKDFFKAKKETYVRWASRKYCSQKCANVSSRTRVVCEKISKTCKERGIGKWMEGRKRSIHLRVRQSKKMKEVVASGRHNFWKGGISEENRTFKSNFQDTLEYRLWRTAVFERDDYTCQWCGARNGNGKKIVLNADHIKEFALYPELRLVISNGRTLCRGCHYKRHSKP